jgi:hypothetical protein
MAEAFTGCRPQSLLRSLLIVDRLDRALTVSREFIVYFGRSVTDEVTNNFCVSIWLLSTGLKV